MRRSAPGGAVDLAVKSRRRSTCAPRWRTSRRHCSTYSRPDSSPPARCRRRSGSRAAQRVLPETSRSTPRTCASPTRRRRAARGGRAGAGAAGGRYRRRQGRVARRTLLATHRGGHGPAQRQRSLEPRPGRKLDAGLVNPLLEARACAPRGIRPRGDRDRQLHGAQGGRGITLTGGSLRDFVHGVNLSDINAEVVAPTQVCGSRASRPRRRPAA